MRLCNWRKWTRELNHREEEARQTLVFEGIEQETCFVFELNGQHYVAGFVSGIGRPSDKNNKLNKKHSEMLRECLEKVTLGEVLYNFVVRD